MKLDRIASVVFFLIGAVIIREAAGLPMQVETRPGAGFFPMWLGISMVLLSTLLFFTTRSPERPFIQNPRGFRKAALVAISFLVYAFSLGYVGIVMGMFAFLVFLSAWLEKRQWRQWLAMSALLTICSFLVFKVWLGVPLPKGFLGI